MSESKIVPSLMASGSRVPKAVILFEQDLTDPEKRALYATTDDVLFISKFNSHRPISDLFKNNTIICIDLRTNLRYWEANTNIVPAECAVIKRASRTVPIEDMAALKKVLKVTNIVKYLPERKMPLREYLAAISDHMPRGVVRTAGIMAKLLSCCSSEETM